MPSCLAQYQCHVLKHETTLQGRNNLRFWRQKEDCIRKKSEWRFEPQFSKQGHEGKVRSVTHYSEKSTQDHSVSFLVPAADIWRQILRPKRPFIHELNGVPTLSFALVKRSKYIATY